MHEFVDCLDQFPHVFYQGTGFGIYWWVTFLCPVLEASAICHGQENRSLSDILIFQSFGIESSSVEVPGGQRCRKWLTWVHPWIGLWECKKRPKSFLANLQGSSMSGMSSSSLHQVGVPNCPTWCSSQVLKSSAVGLTVTGFFNCCRVLTLRHLETHLSMWSHVLALRCAETHPVYVEGFGYDQGNGPSHLGNAFASGRGLGTLPNFPPTVRNRPYIDSWNAFFAGCQATSCGSRPFDYGYVIFLWAHYSIYLNHFIRQWWSPSSFGRLPAKQPHRIGEGVAPLHYRSNLPYHLRMSTSITSLEGRRGFL